MDSDLFDDFLSENATRNVKPGGKFQPKAKPRPVKKNSGATSFTYSQPVPESVLNEFCGTEKPGSFDDDRRLEVVHASSQHLASTENLDSATALDSGVNVFMPDSNDDWNSCFENPMGESADIFIGLESLDDFLPDSTNVLDNSVPTSEAPNVRVSGSRDAERRLASLIPAVDDSVCMSNIPNVSSQHEFSAPQDPSTGADPVVATDGSLTDNRNLETEELETYPCLEALDMSKLTSNSGRQTGRFQPKSKMQAHRQRSDIDIHNLNVAEPVLYQQNTESVPPRVDVIDQRSGPAFTPNDVLDFSSIPLSEAAPSQSTPEVLADEEPMNFMGTSHQEAGIPGEYLEAVPEIPGKLASRRAKTGKSKTCSASDQSPKEQRASTSNETKVAGRSLRERKKPINAHKLVDESEDEGLEDGDLPAESLSNSVANEDDNTDEEFQLEDEPQTKKVRNKSKKPEGDKEKPVRKRKKDAGVPEQASKAAPKKFSHSTQRRRVDKTLLETPEDEIDVRKVPLRDLVLLAEHKERMARKEAKASQASLRNQSNGRHTADDVEDEAANAFERFGENEAFASAQGGEANDEQESPWGEENPSYFNYQTYMNKTPKSRWSKQDTELFYQAVRQFGTDLSMIQQLFPGRTRKQIKLKYKKEERQYPLRLREALSNPAKDHSHFELVIERLKKIAAEEKQNSSKADSISLTGEEEIEEETHETNEEEAKSEQIDGGVVDKSTEPDFPETQSPVESHDSEDDFFRWSQYKSEL